MTIEALYDLLGTRNIPGTPEQLDVLCIRIAELKELNGEKWIRENSGDLLMQWEYALKTS